MSSMPTIDPLDARILLEPLDKLQQAQTGRFQQELLDKLLIGRSHPVNPDTLPDGMYRFWRKSFMLQGKIITNLALIKFAKRQTFLIDPRGVIRQKWLKVDPDTHAAEVIAALKQHAAR